jgi:hypothetical protein
MPPLSKISLKFHYLFILPQKEPRTFEDLPPRIKQKILLTKGVGIIQLFNFKI